MKDDKVNNNISGWKQKLFITDHYSPFTCIAVSLLSFILAAVMLYSVYSPNNEFPAYGELVFHTGEVSSVRKTKYSVDIIFNNNDSRFKYMSKGNALSRVDDMARQSGKLSVGYIPTEKTSHTIFDIRLNKTNIRSYDEIKKAYSDDDDIVNWLAPLFFLVGIYLGLVGYFSRKYSA